MKRILLIAGLVTLLFGDRRRPKIGRNGWDRLATVYGLSKVF